MREHDSLSSVVDVAVIGGGAAGSSAALVLARARRSVALIDSGRPRNAPAAHMHGFLSRDGLPPAELISIARDELARYGLVPTPAEITGVERHDDGSFALRLAAGGVQRARAVIVATGLRDGIPQVDGLRDRWGTDVLHCPYCHGWEVRDQRLVVIGGDTGAVEQALLLRQWSRTVILLTNGVAPSRNDALRLAAVGVAVDAVALERLEVVDDRLVGVRTKEQGTVPADAVFVRPVLLPNNALLDALGCAHDGSSPWTAVDRSGATSVPGVWAAGNVVDPRAQVITAAGEGSAAAIAANQYLSDTDVARALA